MTRQWEEKWIDIRTERGGVHSVEASVRGVFAVRQNPSTGYWEVTHLPSGLAMNAIAAFLGEGGAKRAVDLWEPVYDKWETLSPATLHSDETLRRYIGSQCRAALVGSRIKKAPAEKVQADRNYCNGDEDASLNGYGPSEAA